MRKPLLLLVILSGCIPAAPARLPSAADIPRLEALLVRDTAALPARLSLAVAYRAAGRLAEARTMLDSAVTERPSDPGLQLLLGLTQEESEDWPGARTSYQRYLAVAPAGELRQGIEHRLRYVQRKELESEVRSTLAREAELTATSPDPGTVAVFPFVLQTADSALEPLTRALSELLVTDLAMTDRLRVLERARVQLLLDEIALGRTGAIDPATAARSGRLLRAGRLIQGSIEGDPDQLRLGALVLTAGRDSLSRLSPLIEQDRLVRLFEMEKRLALSIYGSLGIQLTAAERERVLQRHTESLQALLAFGRALEAEDRDDWAAAAAYYGQALRQDPQFGIAATRLQAAASIADAVQTTVQVMIETGVAAQAIPLAPELLQPASNALRSTPATLGLGQSASSVLIPDPIRGILPDPLQRDATAEVLGSEGITSRTLLRIILRRPAN